jgi:hypothetical protein
MPRVCDCPYGNQTALGAPPAQEVDMSTYSETRGFGLKLAWLAPVGGVVYVVGQGIGAAVVTRLEVTPPEMPAAMSAVPPALAAAGAFAAGMILTAGTALAARRMSGRFLARWFMLAILLYVLASLNTALESAIYTKMGGGLFLASYAAASAILCSALVAAVIPGRRLASGFGERFAAWASTRSASAWTRQLVLAIAAFPAIYIFFGIFAGAIVEPYYRGANAFLRIPPMQVIIGMQVLRSTLFLLATLPIIAGWTGTRGQLIVSLGLAHFFLVGLVGLITPGLFPMTMRVVHGVEIFADSMTYAWALVALVGIPVTQRRAIGGQLAAV